MGVKVLPFRKKRGEPAQLFPHFRMIDVVTMWWNRWLKGKPSLAPLHGAPAVRRMKNYAALSGYAYEYVYEGMRDIEDSREYVFCVSGDRKTWFHVSVRIAEAAIRGWEVCHDRALAGNERYALAKLALFSAFDERQDPAAMKVPIDVEEESVATLLERAGIE